MGILPQKTPPGGGVSVDISDLSWNRIQDYIFKWYPILNNSHSLASSNFNPIPHISI